jgi:hypothetical protein
MKRLTERIKKLQKDDLIVYINGKYEDTIPAEMTNDDIRAVLKKLAAYEDLEEQGLIVRLPCKLGDTVWVVTSPINVFDYDKYDGDAEYEVYESFLSSVSYYASGEQFRIYAKVTNSFIAAYFRECDFGESIFFTREEAEKKLEETKKND